MYHAYADDTQLYTRFDRRSHHSLEIAMAKIEACISDVKHWMLTNKLKLNEDKTEFLVIATPHFFKNNPLPKLSIGETYVTPSQNARNLGVIFDKEMNLNKHISNSIKSLYFHLRTIGKIRRYFDQNTCKTVVASIITSRLDYCNSLLSTAPQKQIHRLQMFQNNAARLINRHKRRDGIHDLLNELHWLPVHLRIQYKQCLITYKTLNAKVTSPSYMLSLLHPYKPSRSLRSSEDHTRLQCPRVKTSRGASSFIAHTPRVWNSLPSNIREEPNIIIFKKLLKTFMFQKCI